MDFAISPKAVEYRTNLQDFMAIHIYPAESIYHAWRNEQPHDSHEPPPMMKELREQARARGLWNLFLPAESGLSALDYAPLAELTGRSPDLAPEALNCAVPDTGTMETLHLFGTPEQRRTWLKPLLAGEIRSAYAMSEPDVASSDAVNIATSIVRDGASYVIDGRKWFITGAADPRCRFLIVVGRTDPDAPPHRRHSQVIVPIDTPGVTVVRNLPLFGFQDRPGHCEIDFTGVRVPVANLIGGEGEGFAIAQARLGPGRVHQCMRAIGMAERAIELMCARAVSRVAFGAPLADQGVVRQWIAESRIAVEQARLLVLKTAWMIDNVGAKEARNEISAIKIVVPRVVCEVVDRAIQIHGALGVSDDTPLAAMYAKARALRILDGPDEVHLRAVARRELKPYR
ncbi:acyl-CoA dehydrogenase family protein [Rhizohabitans arisaemae]|uniref:acyl-CoA dehydrogenase family protein n=1 Tax=Rhizohabitans arisaemae TaxID=2720610 RepID=UPI0024B05F07|nr:acyl-CoA dehydrogenase family protein [Rhizohabitans arisaemae]